jgi:hypothetical protein
MRRKGVLMHKIVAAGLRLCTLLLVMALLLLFISCGGSSSPTFDISGNWNVSFATNGTGGEQGPFLFNFVQSDTTLGGTTSQNEPITGTINDTSVSFSFSWTGTDGATYSYDYTGTVGPDGTTMSGTWTNNNGQAGTWNATFVSQ